MSTRTRRKYQKDEMLTYARKCGFIATESLFDDWVKKGLLGEADERVWPGCGSCAWWSQAQLELFINVLDCHQRNSKNIPLGQLCHIPIWRWLYWGELGGVTLKQAKRAISTWIDFQHTIPEYRFT